MPIEKLENGAWPHPARLPLGCGWSGHCTAPGHDGEALPRQVLEQFCNLGYASGCSRLPSDRVWDAVRFAVAAEREPPQFGNGSTNGRVTSRIVQLQYVCERQHQPVEHGTLEFDGAGMQWVRRHSDSRVQKMAECFLETYLAKRKPVSVSGVAS